MNHDRFAALLGEFVSKRVTVLGDFILDEYLIGDTQRVSREAPIPVIDYSESVYHPGGAANAVQNVASMGAASHAFGVVGRDAHGNILVELLESRGADTSGLVASADLLTAVKTRILAGDLHAQKQQVARIDRSYRVRADDSVLRTLSRTIDDGVAASDAVLISDYGMGVVPGPVSERVIERCREQNLPVVVDSRFQLLGYRGATVATPNEVELFDALERPTKVGSAASDTLAAVAKDAVSAAGLDGLIVTRGSRGMFVYNADGSCEHVGIVGTRDVTDVTGAGDTVSAAVSLALASGATLAEAAEIATYAASVVVMKRGTATVTPDELLSVREKYPMPVAVETERE
jgi:rfaE bifunctional protein kinase chain/domain